MKLWTWICLLLVAGTASAQELGRQATPWLSVTGDAEVKVAPDRVTITLGVQTRDASLATASTRNASAVAAVLAAVKGAGVDPSDMQTDYINVDTEYDSHVPTLVSYYDVQKNISVTVKDVKLFEPVLMAALGAGANHIHQVEFSTSQLRQHRDTARAMAVKAATEKANDMAAAAGLKIKKATAISSYSYGGGSWYGRYWGRGYYSNAQNVIQEAGGGGPQGTISLGKISVTASVTMSFEFE